MKRLLFFLLLLLGFFGPASAAPVLPKLSIGNVALREGTANRRDAIFRVSLSKNATAKVSVVVATKNGTARAGEDYVGTRKTLSFAPGTRQQTFAVPIIGDKKVERDETFLITASAKGYSALNPAATCTIRNDDTTPKPKPTATPRPTSTPRPTATATFIPTSTPVPTATPLPTATPTIPPIIEPAPTATPTSAPTPEPTATAEPTPTPQPTATPEPALPTGKLVISGSVDGKLGIYVMNADGSNRTQISDLLGNNPHWSPDGNKILFVSNGVRVINANGSGLLTVSPAGTRILGAYWNPDSNQILIVANPGSGTLPLCSLYVVNANGSNFHLISSTVSLIGGFQWSHDGKRVVYSDGRGGTSQIYVSDSSGSQQTNISRNARFEGRARWSPDDKRILFNSATGYGSEATSSICTMNPNGNSRAVLVDNIPSPPESKWSPNGQKISYSIFLSSPIRYEFFVMNADGSNPLNLSQYATNGWGQLWSPDSQKFALIISPNGGQQQLYTLGADGTNLIKLSPDGSASDSVVWSPDGKSLGWINYNSPNRILISSADGTALIDTGVSGAGSWSFDWTAGTVPKPPAAPRVKRGSLATS